MPIPDAVTSTCPHERYNSRADCEHCFGRPPLTIDRTKDEFGEDKYFLMNTLTGDWDFGPYPDPATAAANIVAYNAGEEIE